MKSFIQFNEEAMIKMLAKDALPRKVLHWLKRVLHADKYKEVLKLQRIMMKTRGMQPEMAMVKAAQTYGIDPREMRKVMDKETRHK